MLYSSLHCERIKIINKRPGLLHVLYNLSCTKVFSIALDSLLAFFVFLTFSIHLSVTLFIFQCLFLSLSFAVSFLSLTCDSLPAVVDNCSHCAKLISRLFLEGRYQPRELFSLRLTEARSQLFFSLQPCNNNSLLNYAEIK